MEPNPVVEKLKENVLTFKEAMPVVRALRNDKLKEEHWAEIQSLINKPMEIDDANFTLKSLIDMDVNQYADEIATISMQATQEHNLRIQVDKIADIWRTTSFDLTLDDKTDCQIIGDLTDVYAALDDTLAEINMILGSRFVKPLREEAEKWKKEIIYMGDMVEEWWNTQKNWRYLQNIFKGPDIKQALPEESKMFDSVDKFFRSLMKRTNTMALLLKIARS